MYYCKKFKKERTYLGPIRRTTTFLHSENRHRGHLKALLPFPQVLPFFSKIVLRRECWVPEKGRNHE